MERKPIYDADLARRIEQAIADLWAAYPDGKVVHLDSDHKGLANRVGELGKRAGYPSRADFMEAYGFDPVRRGTTGGRPSSVDPESIVAEIARRYENKPKPTSLGQIEEDNPDLAGNIKTIRNASKMHFDDSFANVLKQRGIIAETSPEVNVSDADRMRFEAMVADLSDRYRDEPNRPLSIKTLKKIHPEYADLLDALRDVSQTLYGKSAASYLKDQGVIGVDAAKMSAEDVEGLVERLVAQYVDKPLNEKPSNLSKLRAEQASIAKEIERAQKAWTNSGESFVSMLKRRGVLAPSKAEIRAQQDRAIERSVRNASVEELAAVWLGRGLPAVVVAGSEIAVLPDAAVGVDIVRGLEVRESLFCTVVPKDKGAGALSAGDPLRAYFDHGSFQLCDETGKTVLNREYSITSWDGNELCEEDGDRYYQKRVYDRLSQCADGVPEDSPIASLVGGEVVDVSECEDGSRLLQLRVRYANLLSSATMVNMLVRNGLIGDADLLGGDAWRVRYADALAHVAIQADDAEGRGFADDSKDASAALRESQAGSEGVEELQSASAEVPAVAPEAKRAVECSAKTDPSPVRGDGPRAVKGDICFQLAATASAACPAAGDSLRHAATSAEHARSESAVRARTLDAAQNQEDTPRSPHSAPVESPRTQAAADIRRDTLRRAQESDVAAPVCAVPSDEPDFSDLEQNHPLLEEIYSTPKLNLIRMQGHYVSTSEFTDKFLEYSTALMDKVVVSRREAVDAAVKGAEGARAKCNAAARAVAQYNYPICELLDLCCEGAGNLFRSRTLEDREALLSRVYEVRDLVLTDSRIEGVDVEPYGPLPLPRAYEESLAAIAVLEKRIEPIREKVAGWEAEWIAERNEKKKEAEALDPAAMKYDALEARAVAIQDAINEAGVFAFKRKKELAAELERVRAEQKNYEADKQRFDKLVKDIEDLGKTLASKEASKIWIADWSE